MQSDQDGLLTRAEATNYQETSRHADVMQFIRALQERGDGRLAVRALARVRKGVSFREAAGGERDLHAEYRREARRLVSGAYLVETEQPLGAIAIYLCEARSDDGLVACGVIPEPAPGDEFPVLRVMMPV